MRKIFFLVCLCGVVCCSLVEPPPDVDVPGRFPSANSNLKTTADLPYVAWWKELNDPVLNGLIETALKDNNDLLIARANLEKARGQLRQVQLSWLPFINIYAGFTQNPVFGNIGTFYGIWPQYVTNLMRLPFMQKQADYNIVLHEARINAVRLVLIGQIVSGYLTYLAEIRQRSLLIRLNNDLERLITIKQQALAGGISRAQSVEMLKSQAHQVVAELHVVNHNLVASQNALRFLVNSNPGTILTETDFALLNENLIQPGSLPATVLANRPDLLVAEMQVKIAGEGVKVSASNLFPILQIDRFMAMASGDGTVGRPNKWVGVTDAYLNWRIDPVVFGRIEAGKGTYKAATYNYINTVRQILRDVDNSFAASRFYRAKLKAIRAAYAHAEKEYLLQCDLYETGIISCSRRIEARLLTDRLVLSVNQSKLEYLLVQVLLYQELAGGFRYPLKLPAPVLKGRTPNESGRPGHG